MGKVYLVGAGPGDPELITVKGLNQLKTCDCVVYDRLAGDELLSYTTEECEKIYVGKQPGMHYRKQEEINRILVECAGRFDKVVRLKGGDPFVFGRGGEEIDALVEAGIEYEVIPGITSAIAVPECAGIPVTHREMARSFHVITGHTKGNLSVSDSERNIDNSLAGVDFHNLAKQEGTLVFLMGLSNLKSIADNLIANGKSSLTPAAVISDGTTIYEKQVRGTLSDIAGKVEAAKLNSPAVIVIGDTAKKQYRYISCKAGNAVDGYRNFDNDNEYTDDRGCDTNDEYTDGRVGDTDNDAPYNIFDKVSDIRVGVTATYSLYRRISNAFSKSGIPAVSVCDMEVVPNKESMNSLAEIIRGGIKGEELITYSWIIFTSQNAVRLFFERLNKERADYRILSAVKFAVLGSGTKDTLRQYGFSADFLPSQYTVHTFLEEFTGVLTAEDKVLIPRAQQGSAELFEYTDKWYAESTYLNIYDVKGRATHHINRLDELTHLIFASASGVEAFIKELKERGLTFPENIRTVCIGEITAAKLSGHGRKADVIASVQDVDGLLQAVCSE